MFIISRSLVPKYYLSIIFFISLTRICAGQDQVNGQVLNRDSQSLLKGATILLKGTSMGTLTDDSGKFRLEVPDLNQTLIISYIGYESQEIFLNGKNNLTIELIPKDVNLDDVIVIGYGTQSRRRVTSSISSIDAKAFDRIPENNFQTALGGRIPGLMITQNDGLPGSAVAIRLRGTSSINANNQPLIVVDGMIMNGVNGRRLNGSNRSNPLVSINPGDIESVEVLKDAASSSIYGSQGANGVIIITTKRGKFNSKPKVDIGYSTGFSEPTNWYDLLNGQEYAQLWNQAAETSGIPQGSNQYYEVKEQPSTDWWDLVTRKGYVQSAYANVSEGNTNTQYYLSASY